MISRWDVAVLPAATVGDHIETRGSQGRNTRTADAPADSAGRGSGHRYRGVMARITGHIRIAAPVERVFDTVADSRNEPSFNPAMTGVELLTPPPVGLGTRFRAHMGKAGTEMVVELTEFDRPRRLGSRTASSMMETSGTLTFAAEGEGTVMSWDWQVRFRGWLRVLGPLLGSLGGRMEHRIWTGLKHQLENGAGAHRA